MVARTLHYRNLKGSLRTDALVAVAFTSAAFAPAYGLFRFHDDWTFVDRAAHALLSGRAISFIVSPLEQHWSPLWHVVELINFSIAGWEADWLIRSTIAIVIAAAAIALATLLRAAGSSTMTVWTAIAILVLHPAGAAARFSFDTYSQCIADLIVWATSARVAERLIAGGRFDGVHVAGAAAALAIALLMKEQALSGAAIISMMLLFCAARHPRTVGWRDAWLAIAALAAVAGVFALIRHGMGVRLAADGPFSLCVTCAPRNALELLGAVVLPVRTLIVLDGWRASPVDGTRLALAGVAALLLLVLIGVGLWRGRRAAAADRPDLLPLIGCGLAGSLIPVVLLAHVGELYAHSLVFWFAALAGLAVEGWRSSVAQPFVRAVISVYAAGLMVGMSANLADMRATGERARTWMSRIAAATAPVPDGDWVVVMADGDYKHPRDYGLYRLTTPQVLVMTGLSPASIRYAVRDRLYVVIDQARGEAAWAARIAAAEAAGRLHVVRLSGGSVTLLDR